MLAQHNDSSRFQVADERKKKAKSEVGEAQILPMMAKAATADGGSSSVDYAQYSSMLNSMEVVRYGMGEEVFHQVLLAPIPRRTHPPPSLTHLVAAPLS